MKSNVCYFHVSHLVTFKKIILESFVFSLFTEKLNDSKEHSHLPWTQIPHCSSYIAMADLSKLRNLYIIN